MRARSWKTAAMLVAIASFASAGTGTLGGCVINEPETPSRGVVVVSGPPPAPVHEERHRAESVREPHTGRARQPRQHPREQGAAPCFEAMAKALGN